MSAPSLTAERHSGHWSLDYVKRNYGVPVKRGQRVTHEGDQGVVTCGDGQYVRVRFDGRRRSDRCHPLSLDYGDGVKPVDRLAEHNARIEAWNERLNERPRADERSTP